MDTDIDFSKGVQVSEAVTVEHTPLTPAQQDGISRLIGFAPSHARVEVSTETKLAVRRLRKLLLDNIADDKAPRIRVPLNNSCIIIIPDKTDGHTHVEIMKSELHEIDEYRSQCVTAIRAKYRELAKNKDDVIRFLGTYIGLTFDFYSESEVEERDGVFMVKLFTDRANRDDCYTIKKLAEELCEPYLDITDVDNESGHGYTIYCEKRCF